MLPGLTKKAYDMVSQSWIKMYKIPDEVKVYGEELGYMKSGIDRRKKLSRGKDQEGYIPGRGIFTITICNSDDATQSHS